MSRELSNACFAVSRCVNLQPWKLDIFGNISKQEHNKETPEKLKGTIYMYILVYNQKSAAT
jgi:hypothetical protein